MDPLNAPFPTAWNFWFQPLTGIQSSMVMSESVDGVSLAVTRHSARGARAEPSAAIEPPASTGCAPAMATFGSDSDLRLSHAELSPEGGTAACPLIDAAVVVTINARSHLRVRFGLPFIVHTSPLAASPMA